MDSYDGVEKLRLTEVPDPRPGKGEVLLRVRVAAINPADAFLAVAQYPARPKFPHVLGRDGVGEVLAIGSDVEDIRAGDTLGILRCNVGVETWGTLAEKVVVPAASLAPVPEGWSIDEMAGAPLVFLTAWQALTQWGGCPPAGSVVLVTGASGGVGVASILLGKSMGLTVAALSRSAEKGAKLAALGADFVFDSGCENVGGAITKALAPRKVDLAIDNVGGALFNEVVRTLGYAGKISVVGRSGGVVPEFNTATLFFRRNRIGGVSAGDFTPEQAQSTWTEIVGRLAVMHRRPVIDSVWNFEDVKAAFTRLARGPLGKVLVRASAAKR
jgi:NADPH:quinone reductase